MKKPYLTEFERHCIRIDVSIGHFAIARLRLMQLMREIHKALPNFLKTQ